MSLAEPKEHSPRGPELNVRARLLGSMHISFGLKRPNGPRERYEPTLSRSSRT